MKAGDESPTKKAWKTASATISCWYWPVRGGAPVCAGSVAIIIYVGIKPYLGMELMRAQFLNVFLEFVRILLLQQTINLRNCVLQPIPNPTSIADNTRLDLHRETSENSRQLETNIHVSGGLSQSDRNFHPAQEFP